MSNTNPSTDASVIQMPTGDEIYDALMSKIEPELITTNLPQLDAPYGDETPEARQQRYKRYQQAYVTYDEAFAAWIKTLHAAVDECRHEMLRMAEKKDRSEDESQLTALESAFQTAAA